MAGATTEDKARLLLEVCAAIGEPPAAAAGEIEQRLGPDGLEALEVLAATEGDLHADDAAAAAAGEPEWAVEREPFTCSSCGRRPHGVADFVHWTTDGKAAVLCPDCA